MQRQWMMGMLCGMVSLCTVAPAWSAPVRGGQCCFATSKWPAEGSPAGGCLDTISCNEAEKGLVVRCYHDVQNADLRINVLGTKKPPQYKYCQQKWDVGLPMLADAGGCFKFPMERELPKGRTLSEWVAGPETRIGQDISIWCAGKSQLAAVKAQKKSNTFVFRVGVYRDDYTGRTIKRFENGRAIEEKEVGNYDLVLAEGRIKITK